MEATRTGNVMPEEGRALLTEREREILTGEADVKDNYRYKVESLVRNRVRKRFADDADALEAHFPEVHAMLEDAVCDGPQSSDSSDETDGPDVDTEKLEDALATIQRHRDDPNGIPTWVEDIERYLQEATADD